MTLYQTINAIEVAASRQPTINTIVRNDVFRLNAIPDVKYGVFAWTQGQHSVGQDLQTFTFTFFYVDRLTSDRKNEVEIQSVGMQAIGNIILLLQEWGIPMQDWTAQTFNQRFLDECAGVFASVRIEVPVGYACAFGDTEYPGWNDDRRNQYLQVDEMYVLNETLIIL